MSADMLKYSPGRPARIDCSARTSRPLPNATAVDSSHVQDRAQEDCTHETVVIDAAGAPASGAGQPNLHRFRSENNVIRSSRRRRLAHPSPGQQSLNLALDSHRPPSSNRKYGRNHSTSSRKRRRVASTARATASNEQRLATDGGLFGDEGRDTNHEHGHELCSLPLRKEAALHALDDVAHSILSAATSELSRNSSSSTVVSSFDNNIDHLDGIYPKVEPGPAKTARKTSYTTCISRSHQSSERFSGSATDHVGPATAGNAELPDAHRETSKGGPCLIFIIRAEAGCTFATKMQDIFGRGVCKVADEQENTLSSSSSLKPPFKPVHPFFVAKPRQPKHLSPSKQPQSTNKPQQTLAGAQNSTDSKPDGARTHPARTRSLGKPSTQPNEFPSKSKHDRAFDGPGDSRAKPAGVMEPIWPPRGMVHARGLLGSQQPEGPLGPRALKTAARTLRWSGQRKQKNRVIEVSRDENIIYRFAQKLNDGQDYDRSEHASSSLETGMVEGQHPPALRLPTRLVLRSSELQDMVRKKVSAPLPSSRDMLSSNQPGCVPASGSVHPGLLAVYQLITSSVTAFDSASCETSQWPSKYAPKRAAECLQDGPEVVALRDWLLPLSLEQDTADVSAKRISPDGSTRRKRPRTKPGAAQAEEMQDFIIESEDERDDLDEFRQLDANDGRPSHAKSLMRNGDTKPTKDLSLSKRPMNAVLLSGPGGCGKSAAVYAVAEELGFEVFEINSGSRRNGKDLLEKVGDLAQNHLVRATSRVDRGKGRDIDDVDPATMSNTVASGSTSEAPGPIGNFFKQEPDPKHKRHANTDTVPSRSDADVTLSAKQNRSQMRKDSVILLEEVDVLFDEDRQFWTTVLELLAQSRRPIVLTCNDENLVPIDHNVLHGILRFQPPPITLAVDYLLLVAAAEGHLLSRSAVDGLYRSKRHSLRASIMEMNFWCQMAVGDRKCGLEWMHLERFSEPLVSADQTDRMRVVSKDTYVAGMGWSSHDALVANAADPLALENVLVSDAWTHWEIDIGDWHDDRSLPIWYTPRMLERPATSQAWDAFFDDLSSADVFAGFALANGDQVGATPHTLVRTYSLTILATAGLDGTLYL